VLLLRTRCARAASTLGTGSGVGVLDGFACGLVGVWPVCRNIAEFVRFIDLWRASAETPPASSSPPSSAGAAHQQSGTKASASSPAA